MRIYVASSLQNWEKVRQLYARLESAGHRITYDWTAFGEAMFGDGSIQPVYVRDSLHLQVAAMKELAGVRAADAFVLVTNGGQGAYFEYGVAYGAGKPIVILGNVEQADVKPVSFNYLPHVSVFQDSDVDGLLKYLDGLNVASVRQVGTGCDDSR